MKDILEDIKNNTHQTKELLEKSLELNIRPRNWHDSKTLTATTEKRYNVFKNLGKQGARYLRIKVSKACTIKLGLADVGQAEEFEEGLKANRIGKFRFKAPMLLKDFYITPSATDTVVTWWVSTIEMPVDLEDDMTHLGGDTFQTVSDRAVLIAGEDGTNIRILSVDGGGHLIIVTRGKNFTAQDLTINDANIAADGSFKEFDITADVDAIAIPDSSIIEQISITQLTFANNMNITFQLFEKDSAGYTPTTRADLYLKVFERDIINNDGEWSEVIEAIQYLRDRDGTNELHCRLVNNVGGEASDFAVVIKGKATLDNTADGEGGEV